MPTSRKRPFHTAAILATLAVTTLLAASDARAQIRTSGQVYAMAYASEDPSVDSVRVDLYQGFRVRFRPDNNFDFRGHVRFVRRAAPGDWTARVYQAYADARLSGTDLTFRLGRQFVYRGVINGTMDAVSATFRPDPGWEFQAIAGLSAPYTREVELASWDDGGLLGVHVERSISGKHRIGASYFRRNRGGAVAWHLVGASASFRLADALYLQSNLDYNIEADLVQRMRHRLWYEAGQWILSGELATQQPQIYEDSFFNIFDFDGYSQGRAGVSYGISGVRLGYDLIYTMFDEDESSEHLVTLASRWGTIGFVYQNGYSGDRIGLYADARVDITSRVAVRLHASQLEYQRRSTALTEDATAFSAGLVLRPVRRLMLHLEGQRSYNTYFDQDTRFYARASYAL